MNGYYCNYHKRRPISEKEAQRLLNPTKRELGRRLQNRVGGLEQDSLEIRKTYERT